jgi:DNA polymerase III sliding clamp (beta) subunit (PCNA family)
MITKVMTKSSLVLVDAQGRLCVSLLKDRIKVWEGGFDTMQETYQTVSAEHAKKLAIGLCEKHPFNSDSGIEATGLLIAQEPAELFRKAMLAGETDNVRAYANGVALIGGEHTMVCSNSYVMFKANVAHTSRETVIIPNKLLKALMKVICKKALITVYVENGIVTLTANGFYAQAPAVQTQYPPFKQAFPQGELKPDSLVEDLEFEVKEKKIKSHSGAVYSADNVKIIKEMGFGTQFYIESATRPALFRLHDPWQSEALIVPTRF